ncbi:MAG: putative photosynthetic complex assembly protein PuhE [Acidocella sp.]|nr:putative photosynthetic complex assembly protein PuhE [Acidocella sp.]
MHAYVYPALFALFVWWFSTGAIIYLDNLPRRTFKYSVVGASLVLAGCLVGLHVTAANSTLKSAYEAFFFGLFAWGWQEITFYMGYVTGPRKQPCVEGCGGWAHFVHAVQTSLYHELAIIGSGLAIVALTWHQPNQIGMWTFMVLWWMHQSAKLNVFFGVRNLNEEFLPEHLTFLKSFLKSKPMNLFFPFSITISMVITTMLWEHAAHASTAFTRSGDTFLATMMTLAILEHWFLVIPLPAGKLWKWGLASRKVNKAFEVEITAGFLGAGKTTYMRARLADLAAADQKISGKTVVLVNDFAAVGIDGSLLAAQGADIVELPNGCICCSLRDDLATQLQETVTRFAPDRVLIEPSGVADIASLIGVMQRPALKAFVKALNVTTVIDAGAFLADYAALPAHFGAQARLASTLVINKADIASPAERQMVAETLRRLNPAVRIVTARYGRVDAEPVAVLTLVANKPPHEAHECDALCEHDHAHNHAHDHADDHAHEHAHDHAAGELGFSSWTTNLPGIFDTDALYAVLESIARGRFGDIRRVKGLARCGAGWVNFDVAGGRPSIAAFAATSDETARVVAIGKAIDETKLANALAACTAKQAA